MRTAIYPGTFDPVTFGHIDIIKRACILVDRLVIGVAVSHDKNTLFSLAERVAMVKRVIEGIDSAKIQIYVIPFENLLIDFAHAQKAQIIIRGLRAVSDFEYEFQLVGMNRAMNDRIETVFLMAEAKYQAVASKLVKEIARLGGDIAPFVTHDVAEYLLNKF